MKSPWQVVVVFAVMLAAAFATTSRAVGAVAGNGRVAPGSYYYTIQELAKVDRHGDNVEPLSINDWGQVVGVIPGLGSDAGGFSTNPKARGVHLFNPEPSTVLQSVANSGAMAGTACTGNVCTAFAIGPKHPRKPAWIEIDGAISTFAGGINSSGQVAGYLRHGDDSRAAFVTGPRASGVTVLGSLPESLAVAINDAGQVVGKYFDGSWHAFLRDADGTLHVFDWPSVTPAGMNASGQIVGNDCNGSCPLITGPNGQDPHSLALIDGATGAALLAINARGQAVGAEFVYLDGVGQNLALVTDLRATHLYRLESLVADLPPGIHLLEGRSINGNGLIVADGSDGRAYLLTPIRGRQLD